MYAFILWISLIDRLWGVNIINDIFTISLSRNNGKIPWNNNMTTCTSTSPLPPRDNLSRASNCCERKTWIIVGAVYMSVFDLILKGANTSGVKRWIFFIYFYTSIKTSKINRCIKLNYKLFNTSATCNTSHL